MESFVPLHYKLSSLADKTALRVQVLQLAPSEIDLKIPKKGVKNVNIVHYIFIIPGEYT